MSPTDLVLAELGNGPRSASMLAGGLMRHGWQVTAVDAAVAHAVYTLLCAKRIASSEVDGELVYHLPDGVKMEKES